MDRRAPISASAAKNECGVLKNYAVYFSPIVWMESRPPFELHGVYGIALLVPARCASPDFKILCASITDTVLCSSILSKWYTNGMISVRNAALITCDLNTINGNITIFFHSKSLFDILHM